MNWTIGLLVFTSGLLAPYTDWMAAGDRALDAGNSRMAATYFARALDAGLRNTAPVTDLLHLRISLATVLLEARNYHDAEVVLLEAQKATGPGDRALARAELLNAWSALHCRRGQLSVAEDELREAERLTATSPVHADLRPTILHNLAAIQMRTGRYTEALAKEREAIDSWQKALTPEHPKLIRAWASLASLQYMMGRPQEARLSMEKALTSAWKTYGPRNPLLADLLDSDAIILDRLKEKKQSKLDRAQARQIRGTTAHPADDRLTWNIREAASGSICLQPR
jgi:tetratricopeptide (TPR) repeat protein